MAAAVDGVTPPAADAGRAGGVATDRGRVRVLQVLEATAGGTRRHLISLLRGLDRTAFDVEVAAPLVRDGHELDTRFADEVRALGVPLHAVAMHRSVRPWADFKGLVRLVALMRRGRYDVVHLHSSKAGFLGRIAAKLNRQRTVYTPNGFYFLNSDSALARRFFLVLEQFAGLLTDRLIAVSDSERQATVDHRAVAARKIAVIPNAIEAEFTADPAARARVRAELGIAPGTVVVGTVARFIRQKDPLAFIRAARAVLERAPATRFLWCGEGGDLEVQTRELARTLQVDRAMTFVGFRHDIQDVMNAFDVFALASIFEGMPYSLLEAMFLDLPVAATDVVGTRDVVVRGETGMLAPPGRPDELARAIVELVTDAETRRRLGRNGGALARVRYGVERMVADIEIVYRELARGRR